MAKRNARHCSIEDCARLVVARGWCGAHYRRWHVYGDPLKGGPFQPANPSKLCKIDGCERVHFGDGLCSAHFRRAVNHGDAEGGRGSTALGIASRVLPCSAEDCANLSKSRGLCWSHLNQQRYAADPERWHRYSHERRARRRNVTVETFTSSEILERDRWVCGLCRKKISRRLRWPHTRSASVDHVVPLSEGGAHSRANVQAAHLGCNLSKGVGGSQQLALIG